MGQGKEHRRYRKNIYSPEIHATLIRHLKAGAFKEHAARAAGIAANTLEDWLKRGREGDRKYAQLVADVEQTIAEEACRQTAVISAAALKKGSGDWKAAAWLLEKKYPKIFGRSLEPAVGVSIGNDNGEDGEQPQRTQVVFYLPDNGRRPLEDE